MKHARPDYERFQDPLGLIPADEPVFLIRGQDKAAPETLRRWADLADEAGADEDIVNRVLRHADDMDQWQRDRASKVPDIPAEVPRLPPYHPLVAAVRAAKMAMFIHDRQEQPNDSWRAGINGDIAVAEEALAQAGSPVQAPVYVRRFRHLKSGGEYVLLGIGRMQAAEWVTRPGRDVGLPEHSVDMREVAIYIALADGSLWVRPRAEFEDGRFEELPR